MTSRNGILTIGELLWDLLPDGPVLGGAPANVAVQSHQRGTVVRVVSRVGNDERGQEAKRILAGYGLSTDLIQTDANKPTGTVPVTLDARGNPSFTIIPDVAYDYIEHTPALTTAAQSSALICYGTLAQRNEVTRKTLYRVLEANEKAIRLLDINLRKNCYTQETIQQSLELCSIVKLNRSEVQILREMFSLPEDSDLNVFSAELCRRFTIDACLVTLGENGVFGYQNGGFHIHLAARTVKVQDTIGAGDAFTAGFACTLLRGGDFAECCRAGNILGSYSATKKGGMAKITDEELLSFTLRE